MRFTKSIFFSCSIAAALIVPLMLPLSLYAQQMTRFGLEGRIVYDLREYGGKESTPERMMESLSAL